MIFDRSGWPSLSSWEHTDDVGAVLESGVGVGALDLLNRLDAIEGVEDGGQEECFKILVEVSLLLAKV